MCKHGETSAVKLWSYQHKRLEYKNIDRCMAHLISDLNEYGLITTGCCCGHGKEEVAYIGFASFEDAKQAEKMMSGWEFYINEVGNPGIRKRNTTQTFTTQYCEEKNE